jgi:endonuclease/exonuclease/phosphatase family metal-dependent hydrolase
MAEVTIAVLNLNKGVDRWGERAVLVARELAHLQPNIIGFQEVDLRIDQGNWLCHRVNALREFHTKALYTIHHMANPRDNVTIEALAIMTQLPMVEHEGLDYLIRNRVAHRARLELPEGARLDLYNTHFHHIQDDQGDRWRQEQTEKLLRWIAKNSPDVPHMVVGDLNAGPSSAILKRFKARLRSAFEVVHGQEPAATRAPTWQGPGHELGGVVDYILVSPSIEVLDAWCFCTEPSAEDPTLFPSDHLGLAARVRI